MRLTLLQVQESVVDFSRFSQIVKFKAFQVGRFAVVYKGISPVLSLLHPLRMLCKTSTISQRVRIFMDCRFYL